MEHKHLRMAAFYGLHLVYFPALVASLHLLHHVRVWIEPFTADWMPPWFFPILSCLAAGALYVGLGYGVDWVLRNRFGVVGQESSATWQVE